MDENKLVKYYKLKKDIELLDKFSNEFFLSQEHKNNSAQAICEFRLSCLKIDGNQLIFEDYTNVINSFKESFFELKLDMIIKTVEKMKKQLDDLREELKIECTNFLKNECGIGLD